MLSLCVQAEVRTSFEELYRVMSQREEFRWMMLRIKRMAEPWVSAIRSLAAKQNLARRRRKKVGITYSTLEKSREIGSQSGRGIICYIICILGGILLTFVAVSATTICCTSQFSAHLLL